MKNYNAQEFGNVVQTKLDGRTLVCPICGGVHFTVPNQMASVITGDSFEGIQIGTSIPSGMLICENCGHIHFFALGALGLLPQRDNNEQDKK